MYFILPCVRAEDLKSYRELRYSQVVPQTDWYTCGPAAVSTLLTYFYDKSVSEQEITRLSVKDMISRGRDPRNGFTLLTLKNVLGQYGITSTGYKLDYNQLKSIMGNGLPVLVNTLQPEEHFSVVLAFVDDKVLIADPSWGLRMQNTAQFLGSWNGVTLIPRLSIQQAVLAKKKILTVVRTYRTRAEQLKSGM